MISVVRECVVVVVACKSVLVRILLIRDGNGGNYRKDVKIIQWGISRSSLSPALNF